MNIIVSLEDFSDLEQKYLDSEEYRIFQHKNDNSLYLEAMINYVSECLGTDDWSLEE